VRRALAVVVLLGCLAAVTTLVAWPQVRAGVGHVLSLLVVGDLVGVRDHLRGFGLWAPVVSAALMLGQAVLAPLPAFPLMYANGLLFGALWGGVLSWGSLLLSAVLCFGLARLFGRPLVTRLVTPAALVWVDRHLLRYGPFAVVLARLLPVVSFDVVSYAAGLTRMRLGPFCAATAVGMTPAIFLSAAAGEVGLRSPWALAGGAAAIAALAGVAALLRLALARWIAAARPEPSRTL
jgi:uncharacterized membrane protein YdjX (TVP38/TMEM64 family)